jgi:hypothetical protein
MEKFIQDTHNDAIIDQDAVIEDKVCKPMSYKQLHLFAGEISPTKLASTAKKPYFNSKMTINWHLSITLWNGELEEMYWSGYILNPQYQRNI